MKKQILSLFIVAWMAIAESGDILTPQPDSAFLEKLHSTTEIYSQVELVHSLENQPSESTSLTLEILAQDTKQAREVRMQAICSLSAMANKQSLSILLNILKDELNQRRGYWACVIPALAKLKDRSAIPLLIKTADQKQEHLSGMDHMAIEALAAIGDEREAEFLASKAYIVPVRLAVIEGLTRIATVKSTKTLIEALQATEEPEVVKAAQQGILKIGKAAIPLLNKSLENFTKEQDKTYSKRITGPPTTIGTMTYSSVGATGIPTLSGTMLIVLSLLLFAVAFRVAKNNGAGKMFVTLLGVSALFLGSGGIKLVSDAEALMGVSLPLPLNLGPNTGQVDIFQGYNIFKNENPNTVTIQALTAAGYDCRDPFASAKPTTAAAPPPIQVCQAGVQLPNSAECEVYCEALLTISDSRLKQNIKFLNELDNGLRIYSFKYLSNYSKSNETYVGVMAQDLLKDTRYKKAVLTMENNYYGVDYSALGLKMITLKQWNQSPDQIQMNAKRTDSRLSYEELPSMELGLETMRKPVDSRIDQLLLTPFTFKSKVGN
ncbi:hypothetical protein GQR58_006704 [Nymphon striatum]|nr:hypothetical protein GQR58_006704 [Nymphon striatum]